ncbi:hypothetical protein EKD04_012680 [Chloroflexales bacterium ZM16-3]|nr:hypothetical protein [Chloroflexales bacterium ZM16-3]
MDRQPRWKRMALFAIVLILVLMPLASQPAYAYCGSGSNTAYQDCIMEDAARAGRTAPTQPSTPYDDAVYQAYLDAEQQRQAEAERVALNFLAQSDSDLAYFQRVLASGGDPNVFFGQSSLPSLGSNLFLDPFFAGPGMPVLPSDNAIPAFMPDFLDSLSSFQNSPVDPVTPIDYSALNPPGSCSTGDFFQPTTISFYNLASRPLIISLVDTRCQEITYIVLPPQRFYISLTFVGQSWSFRDGITGELVQGDSYYTIPDSSPQISITTDVLNAAAMRSKGSIQSSLTVAPPDVPAVSSSGQELAQRLAAMRERQSDQVYSDPALQALQAEASNYLLDQIYADPLALYLLQERDTLDDQVRMSSPDYATAKALAAEIAGWTDAPKDQAVLRERYAKRSQLEILTAHVDDDAAVYLLNHPDTATKLSNLSQRLQQRVDDLSHTPEALLWQANWQQRWDIAYYTSDRGIAEIQDLLDIQARNPDFAEYQKLNIEVGNLLPSLSDTPPVQHISDLQRQADSNLSVRGQLRALTDQFHTASAAAIDSAGASSILEQFYERVNALGQAGNAYRDLRNAGDTAEANLAAFRNQVHTAVAACYSRSGNACDPATDRDAQRLIQSGQATPLVRAVTTFYQQHDAFWHSFYIGQGYLDLENQAKADLEAPLNAAQPAIDAARSAYEKAQDAISAIGTLHAAQQQIYNNLCSTAGLNSLPVGDPTTALCSRINRMADLAHGFVAEANTQSTNRLFLPLVRR